MTLPSLLIIGAMKAGTTTVFRDVELHPGVFFPLDKEPGNLLTNDVLTDAGRRAYERIYARARADQIGADASTTYSKRPTFEGVAKRARAVLGPETAIVYMVREPIARIISQHHHELSAGDFRQDRPEEASIDQCVRTHEHLAAYSRYAWQIEPWRDAFGKDRVRIVRFEDYVRNRAAEATAIWQLAGLDPKPELIDDAKSFNRSDTKRVARGRWKHVVNNPAYRKVVRPLLPRSIKERVRDTVLPKALPKAAPPTPETVDALIAQLTPDVERLGRLMGLPGPAWDLEEVRRTHHERYQQYSSQDADQHPPA